MEAMWSRFLPHYDVVRHIVESGLIGDVVAVLADHGQRLYPDGPARLAQPELAGGALLDLGVYPVSFADLVLGAPDGRHGHRHADRARRRRHDDDHRHRRRRRPRRALVHDLAAVTPCTAVVAGTEARLELSGAFYGAGSGIRLVSHSNEVLDERAGALPEDVRGFSYEAAEFARCLVAGERESLSRPQATTMRVMETMDEVRRQSASAIPASSRHVVAATCGRL